jgi:hypothetical protein
LQTCQQNGNGERENLPSEGGLDRQKAVALADGAYCNGGDEELLKMLAKRVSLFQLSAYAGWNTSSNTLGTAISAGVFTFLFGRNAESKRFLAKRLIEDMGYCGYVRGYLCKEVLPKTRFSYFYAEEKNGEVAAMVQAALQEYMGQNFAEVMEHYKIIKCEMPWRRMFEVDLEVAERDAGSSNI